MHRTRRAGPAVAGACLLLALLGSAPGCGSGNRNAKIGGSVSVNDKPVTSGTVTFLHEDGRSAHALISPAGTYEMRDAPVGKVKIVVKGMDFARFVKGLPKRDAGGKMQDPNDPGKTAALQG